jgi:NADH:ubiquinone oxidoreductase subunit 3 (subunit A)
MLVTPNNPHCIKLQATASVDTLPVWIYVIIGVVVCVCLLIVMVAIVWFLRGDRDDSDKAKGDRFHPYINVFYHSNVFKSFRFNQY